MKKNKMMLRSAAVVAALASMSVMAFGATSALFSATQASGSNSFAAGTVSVGAGTGTSVTCNVTNMVPGDSSTGFGAGSGALAQCSYKVKYTGTASAWLAVDVAVSGGATNLFTGTSGGLQYLVKANGGSTFVNGTTYKVAAGTDTTVVSGTPVTNMLVSATPAVTNGETEFDIDYELPLAAANALQGGTSSIVLTFHAVQSANNPLGSCVAGRQCTTITWS